MTFRLRPLHEDQKIKWNIEEITLREVRFYAPMGTQLDK